MRCPKCEGRNLRVVDTLPIEKGKVYRRRKCGNCGKLIRTVEIVDDGSKTFEYGYSAAVAAKEERRKNVRNKQ